MVVGAQTQAVDTLVIGSGPGGYVAAIRAAELGQKVAIVEKNQIGGVCLNVGCIPSKALIGVGHAYHAATHDTPFGLTVDDPELDWQKAQSWKQNEVVNTLTTGVKMLLKKHQVEIYKGEARFADDKVVNVMTDDSSTLLEFNHAILATGSRPVEIPGFTFEGRIIDSTAALSLPEIPETLTIIGGGVIGSELAGVYSNLGTKVTIIEGLPQILNGFDKEMIQPVLSHFEKNQVKIVTNAQAKSSQQDDDGVTVTYEVDGESATVKSDYVLVSVGRRPNTDEIGLNATDVKLTDRGLVVVNDQQQTTAPHIYAIGDIVAGPALAHKASFEAKVAAAAISGQDITNDAIAMPSVAYTDPELATVGETLMSIKDKNLDAKVSKFPFAANGRAITMHQTDGFIRLITDKETDILLGAQIVGPNASDLINEMSLAIENGLRAEDISLTIHPHPTLGEAIMDTAELADGLPIHI
ncbi:dihydrolipoyl dehydrogenase [Leuconostoc fallax]|uniref:dihydrolipoyl dehydrogenase n=1 Tax=Leuconostoc fallax TaxID=1251 RepID=UPI002090EE37|nr:dihydrolipoyl dehydrogenase [Leuconostoc fallax]MCO6183842.1 dihydrolipoyl dehydrogenase [Leuconostoc fallax]